MYFLTQLSFILVTTHLAIGFELNFIHINDFHAKFMPVSLLAGNCKPEDNDRGLCYGGIARIVTAIRDLQSKLPNTVLLNAGDVFQGSLLYSLFKWNITLDFMNRIPFDATALGNHEFDDGVAGIEPYLSGLTSPVVAVNMNVSLEPTLMGKYQPSVVIERGGRSIGIIGCISKYTPKISNSENVTFNDELETVSAEAARLRARGVDIIVLLSHSGYQEDQEFAQNIADLDVIVGAHSHTFLYTGEPSSIEKPKGEYPTVVTQNNGRKVLIVQAYAHSKYLGVLRVQFDAEGEVTSWSGAPKLLDSSVAEDAETKALLQPWVDDASVLGDQPLGTSAVHLSATQCHHGECNLGNFYADAMVSAFAETDLQGGWTKAALAIMHSGGIRAPLGENPNITYSDLVASQPFSNTVDTIELQGKDIMEILQISASKKWRNPLDITTNEKGIMQVSGMQPTFKFTDTGVRLVDLQLRCAKCRVPVLEPVDPEAWYTVAMLSFLSNGRDKYRIIAERGRNKFVGEPDIDVFSRYIKSQSPIIHGIEGRIKVIVENLNSSNLH